MLNPITWIAARLSRRRSTTVQHIRVTLTMHLDTPLPDDIARPMMREYVETLKLLQLTTTDPRMSGQRFRVKSHLRVEAAP